MMGSEIIAAVKRCFGKILSVLPLRNMILFESMPDCSGNTKPVFDELVRRGYNRKYRMVWRLHQSEPGEHDRIPNVRYLKEGRRLYLRYYFAKMFISENAYFQKTRSKGQYMMHITHGGALKKVNQYYRTPDDVDEVVTFSRYLIPVDAENNGCDIGKINPLGYPRNDALLGERRNLSDLFPGHGFRKTIVWLPTFRQHKNHTDLRFSSISIPIIHDSGSARKVDDAAGRSGVLIVVKPHFAQDISFTKSLEMDNIVFIDDRFLQDRGMKLYDLLCSSDALLTDYSSVYYDYLLTGRPIGLCWEDFDEYKANEGFIVDTDTIMAGGEKIYTAEDLCAFIGRIGSESDLLADERAHVRTLIFGDTEQNFRSTVRVADRVVEILERL